jgi:hypothetical protein
MKLGMYSNNWLMKWFECKHCQKTFKRGYTKEECDKIGLSTKNGNDWFPELVDVTKKKIEGGIKNEI